MTEGCAAIHRDPNRLEKSAAQKPHKVQQVDVQSPPSGRNTSRHPYIGEGCPAGKQLGRQGPGSPGGQQVDHETAMHPHGKEDQQPPGLH